MEPTIWDAITLGYTEPGEQWALLAMLLAVMGWGFWMTWKESPVAIAAALTLTWRPPLSGGRDGAVLCRCVLPPMRREQCCCSAG